MRFINRTRYQVIKIAATKADELLKINSPMVREILKKNDFQYDSGDSKEIVQKLIIKKPAINIFSYRPWNPWTKTVGYFDGVSIHININFLKKANFNSLVGFLLHEYAHYCGFHHGNNFKTNHKCLYSVPYFLSENVDKFLS